MDHVVTGLVIGAVYSLIAIGFSLTYRAIGLLNFAHPEFMMVGAMVGYTLTSSFGVPMMLAVPVAAVAGGAVAYLVDLVSIQFIVKRRAAESNRIIATVGWSYVVANLALVVWGPDTFAYPASSTQGLLNPMPIAGTTINLENILIFVSAAVLMLAFHLFLKSTRLGYAIRATADDPEAAAMSGVRLQQVEAWTFILSGVLGGIAGVFIGALFFANFGLGSFGLRAFAPAVIGGFGNVVGAMVGGLIFGLIQTFSTAYLGQGYQDVLTYGVVIVFLIVRPTGLFGSFRRTA